MSDSIDSASTAAVPTFGSVVLDCPNPAALAGFYAALLDWPLEPDQNETWVRLVGPEGGSPIEFQQVLDYQAPQWPSARYPQQLHLDLRVSDMTSAHERAVRLGAQLLGERPGRFRVYADPDGHPFCLCQC